MKFELTIEEKDGHLHCSILDSAVEELTSLTSESFNDAESKRKALNSFYHWIPQALRQRQFPSDSLVFEKEGQFAVCKGYPEESK